MTIEAPAKTDAAPAADSVKTDAAPAADAKTDAAPKPDAKTDAAPKADATAPRKTILGGEPAKPGAPAKDAPAAKPEGAPEKYTDFTLPEGVTPDAKLMDGFKALAKELKLSQVDGQKLVDLQAQNVKAEIDGRLAAFNNQVETWDKETRAHFGANSDKAFADAAVAMEQIGTPELRTLANESGLGSHPEFVKFFAKVGAMLREDNPPQGGKGAGGEAASTASLMFPSMNKK